MANDLPHYRYIFYTCEDLTVEYHGSYAANPVFLSKKQYFFQNKKSANMIDAALFLPISNLYIFSNPVSSRPFCPDIQRPVRMAD